MVIEYDSIIANGTQRLVDCPRNVKPIDCKWVYKLIYYKANGEVDKYKARVVEKGFFQQQKKAQIMKQHLNNQQSGTQS